MKSRSRCCVGGCSNVSGDGVSLHTFPKDDKVRKKWISRIQLTGSDCSRAGWKGPKKDGSSNAQIVCSKHFELGMFTSTTRTKWTLGLPVRPVLTDGAVPTLFGENVRKSNAVEEISRPAVRKREVQRILKDFHTKKSVEVVETVPATVPLVEVNADVQMESTNDMIPIDPDADFDSNNITIMPSLESTLPSQHKPPVTDAVAILNEDTEMHVNQSLVTKFRQQKSVDGLTSLKGGNQNRSNSARNSKKKTTECLCHKCSVTTVSKGTQVNRRPPPIKCRTKGTETMKEHHITFSTSSTQYHDTDIAVCQTPTPAHKEPLMATPLPPPTLASTPSRKKATVTVESPGNKSFMSTSSFGLIDNETSDPNYEPEMSFASDYDYEEQKQTDVHSQRKFLVFEDNLLELFHHCVKCHLPTEGNICNIQGSAISVKQICDCEHVRKWDSQPKVRCIPAGNLILSAAILFSGCLPSKALRLFNFANILVVSLATFFKHQRNILWPAIERVWTNSNTELLSQLLNREEELIVSGDGRADSPGHSAKFGAYSMIDMHSGKVVALELVQSNEVKSSYHMELEGLQRAIEHLRRSGLSIAEIITDRHLQIGKWLREKLPGTVHSYDVWHVGKAVKKKLLALSKEKDCQSVGKWMKSVTNHLYWSAGSSHGEGGSVIVAKWESVVNHVQDIHTGHGKLFTQCQHGPLEPREWLKPGSKAAVKMEEVILNKRLCKDVMKLSTGYQTSMLEAFHSVINQFAPKMTSFSFHGQLCRQYLAAMHFNENVRRKEKVNLNGKFCVQVVFPKYKDKDDFSVRLVRQEMTFNYVNELFVKCVEICGEDNTIHTPAPPPLTAGKRKPTKVEVARCLSYKYKRLKY